MKCPGRAGQEPTCGKKREDVVHVCFNVLGKDEVGSLLSATLPDLESMVELSIASADREMQSAPCMGPGGILLLFLLQLSPAVCKPLLCLHPKALCKASNAIPSGEGMGHSPPSPCGASLQSLLCAGCLPALPPPDFQAK